MDYDAIGHGGNEGNVGGAIDPRSLNQQSPYGNGSESDGSGGNVGGNGFDPEAPYGRKADGTPRKRRGRKPGSGNSARIGAQAPQAPAIDVIAQSLLVAHAAASALLHMPELGLEEWEAKELAKASAQVLDQYGATVSPKTAAWINLATVMGAVYGRRALVIALKQKGASNGEPAHAS